MCVCLWEVVLTSFFRGKVGGGGGGGEVGGEQDGYQIFTSVVRMLPSPAALSYSYTVCTLRRSDGTPQASLSIPATFFQGGCRKQVLGVCGPIDPPDLWDGSSRRPGTTTSSHCTKQLETPHTRKKKKKKKKAGTACCTETIVAARNVEEGTKFPGSWFTAELLKQKLSR